MNSDQRIGLAFLFLSIITFVGTGPIFPTGGTYEAYEYVLIPAGKIIPGICFAGWGIGLLAGKFETSEKPNRTLIVLSVIVAVAFAVGAFIAV